MLDYNSNVTFPHTLYQHNDPNFPNCLLYDENGPSTGAVTVRLLVPMATELHTYSLDDGDLLKTCIIETQA